MAGDVMSLCERFSRVSRMTKLCSDMDGFADGTGHDEVLVVKLGGFLLKLGFGGCDGFWLWLWWSMTKLGVYDRMESWLGVMSVQLDVLFLWTLFIFIVYSEDGKMAA